jgi:NTP pyrophosphatase (non-canonical NTP hydrolase)
MKLDEYVKEATSLAKYKHLPINLQLAYLLLQLNSEAGEVAAEFAKPWRKRGEEAVFDDDAIKLELGDVMWYVINIADLCHFAVEDILQMNIDKLKGRYGVK